MKLKPSLLQLFVVLMVSSLLTSFLAACSNTASRPECQVPLDQRPPSCNASRSGGSSVIHRSGSGVFRSNGSRNQTGRSNVSPTGRKSGSFGSQSTTRTGRSGFGSFGRGSSSS